MMGRTQRRTAKGRKVNENDAPRRTRDGGCQTLPAPNRETLAQGAARVSAMLAAKVGVQ